MNEMTRKVALCQSLNMLKTLFPEEYNFYPRTWFLPDQLEKFQTDVTMATNKHPHRKMTFIVKPSHGSQVRANCEASNEFSLFSAVMDKTY